MSKTYRKAMAGFAAAIALAAGGVAVAAPAQAAGYTYLYPTDFGSQSACNTKRLTMNSSWTRASQCFIMTDTGRVVWKFSVTVRG
ncbi:hypothetical protein PSET11_02058 [Arthrobacter ulcerisalmonis]|uniref:Secreted protein n=1 Tax=Arthrobacter ulcerisalmonis TaxID=2483813 RepID=A0A3P5XC36_9MICC|nr:hypothetical protein [Arthrobacter ulcerisalmonis]VDC27778.1 hypothetical protein PSET11_02058 [Arthrobacter ulcerisalmonis]